MVEITRKPEKGQGLVEYALILVLVSLVVMAVMVFLGPTIGNVYSQIMSPLGFVSAAPLPSPTPLPGNVTPMGAVIDYCSSNGIPSNTIVNVYHSLTVPTVYYIAGIHGTGDITPPGFATGHDHLQCP
jgi:pilus assembly protein Flp/PilA